MILHTTEVTSLPSYRLFLRFSNGEVFEALRDPLLFATASQHPVMRTAAWANGSELAPEFLLDLMEAQQGNRAA
ncbi:MAG TPA: hypothetical protein PKZ67_12065 [Accumulibacter sp.]|uniref:DUF2442 domain-containing protein n=2 Tax=Candidatus Accumulibacter TaxID=327159 RepID=A0A7D5NBY3_9PROT|nr:MULTISPECIES: hypothetical protein [Candidatus Accumulibacter]QLH50510.1 MAG: hypothetical protein HWD57_12495 [Candidatus Accumulibacter cognatus]MBL8399881.1 hypothetical protein [Accumulibacter sp.]MBN8516558.1 hypothetical protein [Accumulibacter sp.]MBO3710191.1 hypothetical protein [Accumulibacter sp.]MCC2867826.1 hypothetical protein [Candidatus Accumulibacter phosphatis]